jgi:hypothetical protein
MLVEFVGEVVGLLLEVVDLRSEIQIVKSKLKFENIHRFEKIMVYEPSVRI